MKVFVLDKDYRVEDVGIKDIPAVIKAKEPATFNFTLDGRDFRVVGSLDVGSPFMVTGFSEDMSVPFFIGPVGVFRDDGLTDEDIKFLKDHLKGIVDVDFDDNYKAFVGIEKVTE